MKRRSLLMAAAATAKPVNNKCPVCGTMAEPFRSSASYESNCRSVIDFNSGRARLMCDKATAPENLTRCLNCNNAFWQEAEN